MSEGGRVLHRTDLLNMIRNWGYQPVKIWCKGTTVYIVVRERPGTDIDYVEGSYIDNLLYRNRTVHKPPTKESYFEDFAKSIEMVTPDWINTRTKLYSTSTSPYR